MLMCDLDYGGSDITSLDLTSLQQCIIACQNIGPTCLGVSYIPNGELGNNRCYVKYDMDPSYQGSFQVNSAVRIRGESRPSELLINGCFANDLSFWSGQKPGEDVQPTNFIWQDGTA